MTATRESRNAGLIEDGVEAARRELDEVADLYRRVLPHLPAGFPLLHGELADARNAANALRAAARA